MRLKCRTDRVEDLRQSKRARAREREQERERNMKKKSTKSVCLNEDVN